MRLDSVLGPAAVLCAVALAGCTSGSPGPAPKTSVAGASTCGSDISAGAGLLDAANLTVPRGSAVGRSVTAVSLATPACGVPASGGVVMVSCDPAEFPWTRSAVSRNHELFQQGVRVVRQATLEVDAKPMLREVVLDSYPGGALTAAYREHVTRCGGTAVARANGALQQATLPGAQRLVVAFNGDDQVVALQGLGGQSADELNRLMPTALRLAK